MNDKNLTFSKMLMLKRKMIIKPINAQCYIFKGLTFMGYKQKPIMATGFLYNYN